MPFIPRPYQVDDLAVLIAAKKPLLSDAGTGKTPTACMYTKYVIENHGYKAVWIMPGSLLGKNYDDLIEFGLFAPHEVCIVDGPAAKREKLLSDPKVKVWVMTAQCWTNNWRLFMNMQPKIRLIMGDEWHLYFASHKSARTQQMYQWVPYMFATIPMTGSMIKGRLDSAYPMFHAFFPLYYGTYDQFMAKHAMFDENGRVCGWRNHEYLKGLLKTLTIRRSFGEVYGKENKVIIPHKVHFDGAHREIYDRWKVTNSIEREDDLLAADGNAAIVALRSRQILSCPESIGVMPNPPFVTQKDIDLEAYVEDHLLSGERLVIFSVWKAEQERIVAMIQRLKGKVGLINGEVPNSRRIQIDQQFQKSEIQFIVASPKTAGVGYNWGFLEEMIFVTADYEDESFIQAYRRGIRGVRKTPLKIVMMVYRSSIEEYILTQVEEKSRHANAVDDTKDILELGKHKVAKLGEDVTVATKVAPGGFRMSDVLTEVEAQPVAKLSFGTMVAAPINKLKFSMDDMQ